MDYELLYGELHAMEKKLKESLNAAQKLSKAIARDTENGDLKTLDKELSVYAELLETQTEIVKNLQEAVDGFDSKTYFESGEFAGQMLALCEEKGVDVTGEYPVFEMFPYRVKFDTENQDIYLDRKKVQCIRPRSFVDTVKAGQERLMKASFNALGFANELAEAYDMALLKAKKQPEADLYLTSLYQFLVPMGRFRREYDKQSFAFDLARLYSAELEEIKDGRRFQFGPSRNNNKAIRIIDQEGKEQFLATIRFFR